MRIRSFVAWVSRGRPGRRPPGDEVSAGWQEWSDGGALTVQYVPRVSAAGTASPKLPLLVLGDDSEVEAGRPGMSLAGGVPIRYDATSGALSIDTSIVALPPVYVFESADVVAVASDIEHLRRAPDVVLAFDPVGVTELGWFGHPVEHRTLFRNVAMAPAGGTLTLQRDGTSSFRRTWELPAAAPLPWHDFVERQIDAFTEAVKRTDVSRSFLSLTAGLDTRSVFAALADQQRLIPSVTMTGARLSLDARTARTLCREYGITHRPVVIDERFERELPALVQRANLLSGGLSSLGQAPEVFLYEQLESGYVARLSGNLGNQVGRGGTEGVSVRAADLDILAPALRAELRRDEHWLLRRLHQQPREALEFILQGEIAFSSVGNYTVGNHFAVQQSPYASRALIETLAHHPAGGSDIASRSKLAMRLRDLRHRFLGEPEHVSFQRALVRRIGGPAARIPVNWGWRPAGFVSLRGLAMGMATLTGMAARAKGLDDMLAWTALPSLHDFRASRRWLREGLREFTRDTFQSKAVRDAGVFDLAKLDRVATEYFGGGRDHYETVTYALDLALAHRLTRR